MNPNNIKIFEYVAFYCSKRIFFLNASALSLLSIGFLEHTLHKYLSYRTFIDELFTFPSKKCRFASKKHQSYLFFGNKKKKKMHTAQHRRI